MTGPSPDLIEANVRLQRLCRAAAGMLGLALVTTGVGAPRLAIASLTIALFLQIVAVEGLRRLTLTFRENRR